MNDSNDFFEKAQDVEGSVDDDNREIYQMYEEMMNLVQSQYNGDDDDAADGERKA